jgi:hypothetical protein
MGRLARPNRPWEIAMRSAGSESGRTAVLRGRTSIATGVRPRSTTDRIQPRTSGRSECHVMALSPFRGFSCREPFPRGARRVPVPRVASLLLQPREGRQSIARGVSRGEPPSQAKPRRGGSAMPCHFRPFGTVQNGWHALAVLRVSMGSRWTRRRCRDVALPPFAPSGLDSGRVASHGLTPVAIDCRPLGAA